MKKVFKVCLILFCSNLILIFPSFSVFKAEGPAAKETNTDSFKPLDYLSSRVQKLKSPFTRCLLMVKIAAAYAKLGECVQSEEILSRAADLAKNIKNPLLKSVLIAKIIAGFNDLDKNEIALSLLQYIVYADSRADSLLGIILAYLRQERYAEALGFIQQINDPPLSALAFSKLIDELSEQKKYVELAKLRKTIDSQPPSIQRLMRAILREKNKTQEAQKVNLFASRVSSKRIKALLTLAKEQMDAGSIDSVKRILLEAIMISQGIKREYIKDECLLQIGLCYIKINAFENARALVQSIKYPFCRAELLLAVADAFTQIRQFEKALKVTADIGVSSLKEKALSQILIQLSEQDQEELTGAIIEKLKDASARSRVYASVITYYLQKKNFTKALEISRKIEDRDIKISALIETAKDLQKNQAVSANTQSLFVESLAPLED